MYSGLLQSFQKVKNYLKFQERLLLHPRRLCHCWSCETGLVPRWDDRRMFLLKFPWVKKRKRRELKLCNILNLLDVRPWFSDLSDLLISLWALSLTFAPVEQNRDVHKQCSYFQHIMRIIYRSGPVDDFIVQSPAPWGRSCLGSMIIAWNYLTEWPSKLLVPCPLPEKPLSLSRTLVLGN